MSSINQSKLETAWAWASVLILVVCWDAALRLDERVSLPRMRIAHAVEIERSGRDIGQDIDHDVDQGIESRDL